MRDKWFQALRIEAADRNVADPRGGADSYPLLESEPENYSLFAAVMDSRHSFTVLRVQAMSSGVL